MAEVLEEKKAELSKDNPWVDSVFYLSVNIRLGG